MSQLFIALNKFANVPSKMQVRGVSPSLSLISRFIVILHSLAKLDATAKRAIKDSLFTLS